MSIIKGANLVPYLISDALEQVERVVSVSIRIRGYCGHSIVQFESLFVGGAALLSAFPNPGFRKGRCEDIGHLHGAPLTRAQCQSLLGLFALRFY